MKSRLCCRWLTQSTVSSGAAAYVLKVCRHVSQVLQPHQQVGSKLGDVCRRRRRSAGEQETSVKYVKPAGEQQAGGVRVGGVYVGHAGQEEERRTAG
jgi:hypothetical protein